MKLKKGTLLFLLLTCLAYTTLAQTEHILKYEDLVDENGMLTIDDDGMITACSYDFGDNTEGTQLIIPKSVTKELDGVESEIIINGIANQNPGVFQAKNLVSVVFDDSEVTTIGHSAFYNNSITSLTLPTIVTTIGESAFSNNKLTSVTFAGDQNNKSMIRSIGIGAFEDNSTLTTITLPFNGNNNFGGYKDSNRGEYSEGDQITGFALGYNAFIIYELTAEDIDVDSDGIITECYCDKFTSRDISIPASISKDGNVVNIVGIRHSVFSNKQLTSVLLSEGLISIGVATFRGNSLASLTLPSSVKYIGNNAFYSNNLTAVNFDGDDNNKANIMSIGYEAFGENSDLTSINLPSHTRRNDDDFRYKDGDGNEYKEGVEFKDFNRSLYADIPYTLTDDDIVVDANGMITECYCYNFDSRTITIPNASRQITITEIGNKVFANKYLATLSFSDNSEITSIGNSAFQSNSITKLTLPTSLTTIGESAFQDNQITELTLPTSLTTIGKRAFQDNQITELTLPTSLTTIGNSAFQDNQITKLTMPLSLETIGNYAFSNNQITELTFPDDSQLTSIGDYAFYYNEITTLTMPLSLETIGNYAFSNNQITELTFPDDSQLTSIGDYAFYYNEITTLSLSKNLTTIKKNAFQDNQITTLIIPNDAQLKTIGKEAFRGNEDAEGNKLTTLSLPSSLETIGESAFRNNSLTTVTFNDSNKSRIKNIEKDAFSGNTDELNKGITLPKHAGGTGVTYKDSNDQVYKLEATFTNFDRSLDAVIPTHTLTVDDVDVDGTGIITKCHCTFVSNKIIIPVKIDGNTIRGIADKSSPDKGVFEDKSFVAVAFAGGSQITYIGDSAFYINRITELTLPEGLTVIGGLAFASNKITELTLPEGLTVIGGLAFASNKITELTLPTALTTIERGAFYDNNITELTFPDNSQLASIGGSAFASNPLEYFKLPLVTIEESRPYWKYGNSADLVADLTILKADFEKSFELISIQLVTLTTSVEGQGSTYPDKGENIYEKGTTAALTATPADGWKFDKWVISDEEDKTDEITTITLDKNKSVTAHFVEIVTLTTSVEGQGSTYPDKGENIYEKGTAVVLTATPNEGWRFDKWVISDEENKTDKTTTITLDKNKSVTAHFVEGEEAITSILTEVVSATPYPNPVTSQITLKAKDGDLIQLFSQKGKQQYSAQHTGNEVHTIDVSTIPIGVYLVRITDAEGKTTTKRIVKK